MCVYTHTASRRDQGHEFEKEWREMELEGDRNDVNTVLIYIIICLS